MLKEEGEQEQNIGDREGHSDGVEGAKVLQRFSGTKVRG